MKKIRIVCGTRASRNDFFSATALGRSLQPFMAVGIFDLRIFDENRQGLPKIYNTVIDEARSDPAVLVFAHDDLYICDFYWVNKIHTALAQFDIAGVAGNRRRGRRQMGWAFVDDKIEMDTEAVLSGIIGYGRGIPCDNISFFGEPMKQCRLLDGVFLVADSERLNSVGLRFDERFDFHFYDMDFCRQAEAKGLTMGTWTFNLVHESGGSFGSESWQRGLETYFAKYGE